ncbi:MAG: translation initiation factor IF-2 N-terminal domain-containing protein, partial [Solirubrobacterales bacterium]
MAKKRVHEIAKAQGLSSKELLAALQAAGVEAKAAASSVEEAEALKAISAAKGDGGTAVKTEPKPKSVAKASSSQKPVGADGQAPAASGSASPKKRRVVIDSQAAR